MKKIAASTDGVGGECSKLDYGERDSSWLLEEVKLIPKQNLLKNLLIIIIIAETLTSFRRSLSSLAQHSFRKFFLIFASAAAAMLQHSFTAYFSMAR